MFNRSASPVWCVLVLIALCSATLDYYTPGMGDDLVFHTDLGGDAYTCPNRRTLSFILAHIFGCNGRIFDFMGPIVINLLPRLAAAAVMGLMTAVFYGCVLMAAGLPRRGYLCLSVLLMAVTLGVTPWWDSLWLRVCQFNYLWSAAFGLLTVSLYFRPMSHTHGFWRKAGLFMIAFFAGASHEQVGVALLAAFTCYIVWQGCKLPTDCSRRCLLAGLVMGSLLPLGAPAFWLRVGGEAQRQELMTLLLTTLPVVLFGILLILVLTITGPGRRFLAGLMSGSWPVLVAAAVVSGTIAVYSGIPGRTGVFAQVCALAAMTQMIVHTGWHVRYLRSALVSVGLLALMIAHFAVSISWQRRLYNEYQAVKTAYAASTDGIVYARFTGRYDVSPLTMLRVKGVPDADDVWNLHAMARACRTDNAPLVVLPPTLDGYLDSLMAPVSADGVTVWPYVPVNLQISVDGVGYIPRTDDEPLIVRHTVTATGQPLWIATTRVRDPGDYKLEPAKL